MRSGVSRLFLKLTGFPAVIPYYHGQKIRKGKFRYARIERMYQEPRQDLLQYGSWLKRCFISYPYALGIAAYRMDNALNGLRYILARPKKKALEQWVQELNRPESGAKFFIPPSYAPGAPEQQQPTVFHRKTDTGFSPPPLVEHPATEIRTATDIIIPIWNGLHHLQKLLPSLFSHTSAPHRFLFINDASTDGQLLPWLEKQCQGRSDCLILRHEANAGFPATVNEAAALCQGNFVILNTDTEVPPQWLERLMEPLERHPRTASVTPISCAATIFSFPEIFQDAANKTLLEDHGLERINEVVSSLPACPEDALTAPTGVGFCMAINGKAWKEIGGFNADLFGKGYGEEVDWCQRCLRQGWEHRFQPHLYVAHYHGGSFDSETKKRQMERSASLLSHLYPDYVSRVQQHICKGAWVPFLHAALWRLMTETAEELHLYLTHPWGGGANAYLDRAVKKDVEEGRCAVILEPSSESRPGEYRATVHYKRCVSVFEPVSYTLLPQKASRLVINSLYGWPTEGSGEALLQWVLRLKERYRCRLDYLFHDFYPLCPGLYLMRQGKEYCGAESCAATCQDCLPSLPPLVRSICVQTWRAQWQRFFMQCDSIRFFSENSYTHACRIFRLNEGSAHVKPHDSYTRFPRPFSPSLTPLRVAVVGNISTPAKGMNLLPGLARALQQAVPEAELLIIGDYPHALEKNMKLIRGYHKEQLLDIMEEHKATLCLFPSVWPETYSFVTAELMAMNAPIVAFPLGAPADRLAAYPLAALAQERTASSALAAILHLYTRLNQNQPSTQDEATFP